VKFSSLLIKVLASQIVILLVTTIGFAQRFDGGIRAGMVASEVSGDNLSGPNKPGVYAAVFTSTPVSETSLLKLEIMYIQKGSRSVPSERNNFNDYRLHLQYVEVPLIYMTNIASYTDIRYLDKLWLHGGLSFSRLVGHFEQDEEGIDVTNSARGDEFNPAELNLILGFSYPLVTNFDFVFGFSNSITPLRPHASGGRTWYNWGQYNTLWTLGFSYTIW
jgi:hypothetical protein